MSTKNSNKVAEDDSRQEKYLEMVIAVHLDDDGEAGGHEFVTLPQNPGAWAKAVQETIKSDQQMDIQIDTLSHGLGGVAITFVPWGQGTNPSASVANDNSDNFGLQIRKEKLAELIEALSVAYEHCS